jgi:TRAP-type mannitol/chloroaromatic compound transport system permease small subunit
MSFSGNKECGFVRVLKVLQSHSLRFHKKLTIAVCLLLFLTMFLITGDVAGRYLLGKPIPGTLIIGCCMIVFLVYLSATYTEIMGGHIRVEMISARLSRKLQTLLDIIWVICGLVVLPLLTWQAFLMGLRSWRLGEISLDFPIPLYPVKFAVCAGFFFLFIQFVLNLCFKVIELFTVGKENN